MNISQKSSQAEIEEYQRTLQRAGFYLGNVDGLWGPKTQRAHEAYQASLLKPDESDRDPVASAFTLDSICRRIVHGAERFLNLTETAPNTKWDDLATRGPDAAGADLRALLLETGWQLGWAYCAAFAEVCWRIGYKDRPELALVSRSITPSAMGTFENFERLHRITRAPIPGALMLMQHGDTWQGHAGIVIGVLNGGFATIEGNTSPGAGLNREGDGVYRKSHAFDFAKKSGLWLRGFVNPFLI